MCAVSWGELTVRRPDLTTSGRELLYQFGVGLAFLSTVRRDEGPRLHPICVVLTDAGLYGFLLVSPKSHDLRRDPRFALHSYPTDANEDAFYLTGSAREVVDQTLRTELTHQFIRERPTIGITEDHLAQQLLFEFLLDGCLLTRTTGHGDPAPNHQIWRAG